MNLLKLFGIVGGLILAALTAFIVWEHFDEQHLKSGVVIEREYSPACTYTTIIISNTFDSKGNIVSSIPIPVVTYQPECWSITIRGVGDDGKPRTRTLPVDGREFSEVHLGDIYTCGAGVTQKAKVGE